MSKRPILKGLHKKSNNKAKQTLSEIQSKVNYPTIALKF